MNFDDLADEILEHPSAKAIVEKVQTELKKEQVAREDFREWLNDEVKAEFINGEIVMHSPVKREHLEATGNLYHLLDVYVSMNDLGIVSSGKALIALERNDYEPDIVYWNKQQSKDFHVDTMVHPIPDLVVEVLSKGTKNKDKGIKFDDYAAHQIPEYWMIDYYKKIVYQYTLAKKSDKFYTLLKELDETQTIDCQIIKGFRIPIAAIFEKKASLKILSSFLK